MGAKEGPHVSCVNIKRPHLRVRGLPTGGSLKVVTDQGVELTLEANGIHLLDETELKWIRVSCSVSQRHMTVCEVVSKVA